MARKKRGSDFWECLSVTETGCWEWQGHRGKEGHGQVRIDGKVIGTHRYAFQLTYGYLPQVVRHYVCDNPPCCNPEHLRGGTHQDNSDDKVAKGRAHTGDHRGEKSGHAKLTADQVLKIRNLFARGEATKRELSEQFSVTPEAIHRIIKRKNWRHLMDSQTIETATELLMELPEDAFCGAVLT